MFHDHASNAMFDSLISSNRPTIHPGRNVNFNTNSNFQKESQRDHNYYANDPLQKTVPQKSQKNTGVISASIQKAVSEFQ